MTRYAVWLDVSKETYDKIEAFVEKWPDSSFGPGHIVLDDLNVLDRDIGFCLDKLDTYDPDDFSCEHTVEELAATKVFLTELMAIPEDDR